MLMTDALGRRWPAINYTARDWAGFRGAMLEDARERIPEWVSREPSDFGIMLVETVASAMDVLSLYGDRIANESFLVTAMVRQSVLNHARSYGYRPAGATAAQVTLRFEVEPDFPEAVLIPACAQVSSRDPIDPVIFEVDEDLEITPDPEVPGTNIGTVLATEGITVRDEVLGTSDGTASQVFRLGQNPVVETSIELVVDTGSGGRSWRQVPDLREHNPDELVYEVEEVDGAAVVNFGDNIYGRVPPQGAVIRATYRVGGGKRGNVGPMSLVEIMSYIPGVVDVTNPEPANGGADPEHIDDIRRNAPRALVVIDRAVSERDHGWLALSQPYVSRAAARDVTSGGGQVTVAVHMAPQGGGVPTTDQKEALRAFLQDRTQINYLIQVADPVYVPINMTVEIMPEAGYNADKVTRAVDLALQRILLFERVDFGMRITLGGVYQTINSIEGVVYGTVTVLSRTGSGAGDVQLDKQEIPEAGTITVTALAS